MPSTQTQDLAELQEILQKKSVRFGNFTLVSGQTSDAYVRLQTDNFMQSQGDAR